MPPSRPRTVAALAAAGLALLAPPALAQTADGPTRPVPFEWVEATIDDVHAALADGSLDCRTLVEGYLARIAAYDDAGPDLQSVIATTEDVLEQADALDAAYATGGLTGPLHCVPVLLKDNVDALGADTTAGVTGLVGSRPPDDAFIAARTRASGAVVLGKANLDELAFGFTGSSSVEGLTRNPYEPSYGAGGSSSGTGASIAASLGMVGIGTDTGGSIRVPSSVGGLVGIRPSMRLLSQDGIVPLAHFQDTAGPMCRTVTDCARYLSALVGFDPSPASGQNTLPLQRDDRAVLLPDAAAYEAVTGVPAGFAYEDALEARFPDGLTGVRIGVVRALFGGNAEVNAAMDRAIARLEAAGAVVEDTTIPELSTVTSYSSVSSYEFRDHFDEYLRSWSNGDGHPGSYEEFVATLGYENDSTVSLLSNGARGLTRYQDATYDQNTLERPDVVRTRIGAALDNTDLDGEPLGQPYAALLYPAVQSPPRQGGAPSTGSNNRLSPFSGFPALTMPAGFTTATESVPALPMGMELLGREFDEVTLLAIAAGYEAAVAGTPDARQAPTSTPELPLDAPPPVVPEVPAVPLAGALGLAALAAVGLRGRRREQAGGRFAGGGARS